MNHVDFLDKVIDRGIEAARSTYVRPDQKKKLEGAIAGFEACRGKGVSYLDALLVQANRKVATQFEKEDYQYYSCFQAEIEWVCNCVSAALLNRGQKPIILPTARGVLVAASILKGE